MKPWPQLAVDSPVALPRALKPLPISRAAAMPAESDGGVRAEVTRSNVDGPLVTAARGFAGGDMVGTASEGAEAVVGVRP